jgi:hypothetical protein
MFKLFNCDSIRHFDIGLYMLLNKLIQLPQRGIPFLTPKYNDLQAPEERPVWSRRSNHNRTGHPDRVISFLIYRLKLQAVGSYGALILDKLPDLLRLLINKSPTST